MVVTSEALKYMRSTWVWPVENKFFSLRHIYNHFVSCGPSLNMFKFICECTI